MARFDSRESPDSRESFQGSQTEPLFLRIARWGGQKKNANHRFEAIRSNRLKPVIRDFFWPTKARITGLMRFA